MLLEHKPYGTGRKVNSQHGSLKMGAYPLTVHSQAGFTLADTILAKDTLAGPAIKALSMEICLPRSPKVQNHDGTNLLTLRIRLGVLSKTKRFIAIYR